MTCQDATSVKAGKFTNMEHQTMNQDSLRPGFQFDPEFLIERRSRPRTLDYSQAVVLVGERANQHEESPLGPAYGLLSPVQERLYRGAFRHGLCKQRLQSFGFNWDYSMNLLPAQPTKEAVWDKQAREAARSMFESLLEWCRTTGAKKIILAGSRAVFSAGLPNLPFQEFRYHVSSAEVPYPSHSIRVLVIPHPSGLSRVWNKVPKAEIQDLARSFTSVR